jgi:hypothetical protein
VIQSVLITSHQASDFALFVFFAVKCIAEFRIIEGMLFEEGSPMSCTARFARLDLACGIWRLGFALGIFDLALVTCHLVCGGAAPGNPWFKPTPSLSR